MDLLENSSEKRGSEYVFHESKKRFYELRKSKLPSMCNIHTFPLRPEGPKIGNVSSKRFEPQSGSTRLLHNIICNNIFNTPILPPIMNYSPTFIQKLPQDILRYIYDSYFDIKHTFDAMITVFNSEKCQNLYPQELIPHVKELFTNKLLLMYTLKHINKDSIEGYSFMNVYNEFNKKGAKCNFPLIDCKFTRFTLAWLFYAYH